MPKINVLSEEIINKIAAGEVIERPASVVKELIENSLDAGATKIIVDLLDSGKKLIKVSDNGEGMAPEDAEKSLLRHATSKIKDQNDLFNIQTLGFRGEALASIAAVSELKLITKPADLLEGYFIEVEGGFTIKSGIIGAENGTVMELKNLFYNTPARKKFLKTDAVELRHSIDVIIRYALINPEVSFKLFHEGHELVNAPAVNSGRYKIASIFGINLAKELLEVDYSEEGVIITGFIAPPHHARNDKSQQILFVNKRWIRNSDVLDAVYDAYHSTLFLDKHPVAILHLTVDPEKIDVNVHPTKAEIKFEEREKIYQAVFQAVRASLQKHQLIPSSDKETQEQLSLGSSSRMIMPPKQSSFKYPFETSRQAVFQNQEIVTASSFHSSPKLILEEPSQIMENPKFPSLKLLGQIHKTFFVAETLGGLVYIDQHAAHERVLYEKFRQQFHNQEVEIQVLLTPELLEFSPAEMIIIDENREILNRLGFTMDHFGGTAYSIKTIPLFLGRQQHKEIIFEVLSLLKEGRQQILETKEEIVTRMACRAAVMAGEELTLAQMEKILSQLSQSQLPYTCPHGRPTVLKVPVEELEKKFKRR